MKGDTEQYSTYNYVKKFTNNNRLLKKYHKVKKYALRLTQLGRNQLFGDQELKQKLSERGSTAIVVSEKCSLLKI